MIKRTPTLFYCNPVPWGAMRFHGVFVISQMDRLVDSDGVPVVVPRDMASRSISVEFTQSQQSVDRVIP